MSHQKPGNGRALGGELAADDCWLDGKKDDIEPRPSYWGFVGELVPDVLWGEPTTEYLLGDTLVEIILGVPVGVRRGVM